MKRRYLGLASMMTLCLLLLFISGCGSSDNKEGGGQVVSVSETSCVTCHSTSVERLTGYPIVANYMASVHNLNSVGCQDCHGAGGSHQGKGPIPHPSPDYQQCQGCHNSAKLVTQYASSNHLSAATEDGQAVCNRCHTHQGAVLSAISHYTGDGHVMEARVGAPGEIPDAEPIKCNTCHDTHDAKTLRVDTAWLPSTTVDAATASTNDQYRLCTQCHGYITPLGKLMGSGTATSGTALIGHHETSWYRIIGTTHYDNPATPAIEGYGMRFTSLPDGSANPNPCFDCHGHEAKTNSNVNPSSASYEAGATIYTDWANSGHARGLLTAKFAAGTANPVNTALPRTDPVRVAQGLKQVDAVMAASVAAGPFGGHNSGSCARCHSTEGFSYYFENLANTPVAVATGVLKCYGCHSNPGAGTLRTLKGAKAATNYTTDLGFNPPGYTLAYGKKAYPDVAASNICISCHDSRQNDPAAVTATSNYMRAHFLQGAATMYVKMGFIEFTDAATLVKGSTTVTYRNSLMSSQDVATGTAGAITSTHRILGTPAMVGDSHNPAFFVKGNLDHNGPCVTCHFTGSHSQKMDQRAIDAVCSKCHTSEEGHSILKKADFDKYFLEPQFEVFQDALELAASIFNGKQNVLELTNEKDSAGVPIPRATMRAYLKGTRTEAVAADWATVMTALGAGYDRKKLVGAVSNISFFSSDPAAYAHARTYSRRLIYDSIDYLDDGLMNESVGATAIATLPAVYGKHPTDAFTDSTLTKIATGTTEAMIYLIKWSRTTGKWDTTSQRP